jgi:tryptophan synthase beta subunit
MLLSRHQNAGKNHDIKSTNRSSENVAKLRYLGTAVTNQNLINEKIKSSSNLGNAYYHWAQNIHSFYFVVFI